jgi:hypothetical protein
VTVQDAHPRTSACDFSSGSFNSLNDAPFRVGEGFTDPAAGLTFQVLGRTATGDWRVHVTRH